MSLIYEVVLILIALSLTLFVKALPPKPNDFDCRVCTDESCRMQVSYFDKSMNRSADICNDFYNYACGNFMKDEVWTENYPISNVFLNAHIDVSKEFIADMQELKDDEPMKTFRKLKTYFFNCMNETLIEKEDTRPFKELLNKVGGWPLILGNDWNESDYSWENTVSQISQEGFNPKFPFDVSIVENPVNSTGHVLKLSPGKIVIEKRGISTRNAYEQYITDIALLFGATPEVVVEIKQMVDFEVKLADAITPLEKAREFSPAESLITIEQMYPAYPGIDWLHFMNSIISSSGVIATEDDLISIADEPFTIKVDKLLKNTSKRTMANHQMWMMLSELVDYMPKRFDEKQTLYRSRKDDYRGRGSRDMECMERIRDNFPVAIGSLYLKKHFDNDTIGDITEMVEAIKEATRQTIEELDWMDKKTRAAAVTKAKGIEHMIAYPDEILQDERVEEYYSDLELNPDSYFASFRNLSKFTKKTDFMSIRISGSVHRPLFRKLNLQAKWIQQANVAVVNAYYHSATNKIYLPAGIFREPFYNAKRPNYLNYAALGSIIGHEISHAFDSRGRLFDVNGNFFNWWEPDTDKKFKDKSQCMVDQFNNYTMPSLNLPVNGRLTITENIADNGGLRVAYRAYNNWLKRKNITERCLPLTNFDMTPQQTFWLMAASAWCGRTSPEVLHSIMQIDVHAPLQSRVMVGFANIEEFARDFNCTRGTAMHPEKRCNIW